jgi:hypothetical protein
MSGQVAEKLLCPDFDCSYAVKPHWFVALMILSRIVREKRFAVIKYDQRRSRNTNQKTTVSTKMNFQADDLKRSESESSDASIVFEDSAPYVRPKSLESRSLIVDVFQRHA